MIRWLVFLFIRSALGIPRSVSNRDTFRIALACAHFGYFRVVSVLDELKRDQQPVTWDTVRGFVPEATTAFVESKSSEMEN